ncbi:L-threonylcarbamoyladenylate synthase [Jannaschia sp. LMIT008]|uniref:L-threonylcarbamoyladenylate synthase n=1 Tax=Jannaschia maritima TaxID=3032585 RepID=UPI00281100E6|nr:L-threonylcarbamoyladenylate synthase [Jannaschia sp. LMIT008]
MIARGGLVAFPTETVYGLGADATDPAAVARIYAAKGRPSNNPLIVHVVDQMAAERLAVFDATARLLAAVFWPGPLTLVLPLRDGHGLASAVTAGLSTVAVRVPASPLARRVLLAAGVPVAAPSANRSGRISPTRADHVAAGLGETVDAIVDGGPCPVGVESTIVATDPLRVLRDGGIPREALALASGTAPMADTAPAALQAPGQSASHYAPVRPVRLDVRMRTDDAILIGFGDVEGELTLSVTGDPAEAAASVFAVLHDADALAARLGRTRIDVAPVPEDGLGRAINDRLRRAAAPRA